MQLQSAVDNERTKRNTLRDERIALIEQLRSTEDEATRANLRVRLKANEVELQARRKNVKQRKSSAKALFGAEKAAALSGVVFKTAQAIMQAFALFGPPPSPPGIISAGIATAAGILQGGLIAAEKPPQFHSGFTAGFSTGPDERNAILTAGESVLSSRATENIGRERVDAMNQTGNMPSGGDVGLFFEGRQIDELVTRTINRGGTTRRTVSNLTRRRPRGQAVAFGSR